MVYQLAKEMQLCGNVKNGNDGVHVFFNASEQEAGVFFKKIKATAPKHSTIISSVLTVSPLQQFTDFSIVVETQDHSNKHVLLSPDTALCPACKNELYDKKDTRYRYAFITCTHCGPRYSIIRELPYERHSTAMQDFKMCRRCEEEYHNISDRRFFSQTNSCEDCGIKLSWHEHDMSSLTDNAGEILSRANTMLQQGKILAVKGTGGYLLLCDAGNETAIRLLRSRKHRPAKPFAVLYPGLEAVQDDFDVTELEKELLTSAASPVVLLYKKQGSYIDSAANNIAPGLNRSGIMLPYNPLLSLISSGFGKPLVATSANISGSPIIYKNEDALAYLFSIADHIISYNRDIIIPQDDSVVQITKHSAQQIILRRSRGYAPSFLHYVPQKNGCTLSMGAFLKSSFTLLSLIHI